jgi:hypothetical protein
VRGSPAPSVTRRTIGVRTGDGFVLAHGFTDSVSRESFGRPVGRWLGRFGDTTVPGSGAVPPASGTIGR